MTTKSMPSEMHSVNIETRFVKNVSFLLGKKKEDCECQVCDLKQGEVYQVKNEMGSVEPEVLVVRLDDGSSFHDCGLVLNFPGHFHDNEFKLRPDYQKYLHIIHEEKINQIASGFPESVHLEVKELTIRGKKDIIDNV